MTDASTSPKGHRFPKLVISHAGYLYHRLPISHRDVQKLLFKRGNDVSHETVRAWCVKFGPDLAEALQQRRPRQGRVGHLDEMRIVLGGVVHWLWHAISEHGEVLDVSWCLVAKGDLSGASRVECGSFSLHFLECDVATLLRL